MTRNELSIWQQVEPPVNLPFRVVEVFLTCDGYRTRVTGHNFRTIEEARQWIEDAKRRMDRLAF